MDRRTFLGSTLATAGVVTTAGCSQVTGPTSLGSPREETDGDGMEKHLHYHDDGTRQATVTVDQQWYRSSPTDPFDLSVHVWHREKYTVDRLYFRLRAPPSSVDPPAAVYLKTPDGGPWPAFTLTKDDDLWTVIEVDDIGELGDGTLSLTTRIEPRDAIEEVAIVSEVGLSEHGLLGGEFVASGSTRFQPVVGPP